MIKDELFLKASVDVYAAINLVTSVMCGHIKVTSDELLVCYCLLRRWQDTLGEDVPDPVNKLVSHMEQIAGEMLPVFHQCYELVKDGVQETDLSDIFAVSDAIADDTSEDSNDELSDQMIFIPIERNKYLS